MKETDVESYLRKRVRELDGYARKYVSPGKRGVTDRLCFFPTALLVLVETKAPGKDLEPHQVRERDRMRKLGFESLMLDTREKIDEFIESTRVRIEKRSSM